MQEDAILEAVLAEFEALAKIPRRSKHEKAVSDYLKHYLTDLGFSVVQDMSHNIIADKPATKGFEEAPRTILQGHMDMVCIAEEGYAYDPLRDPIKLVRGEEFLEAEGTSLGADDGIGVAEGIYVLKNAKEHGPLRLIVTTDEEQGMSGAIQLDDKYLFDAEFLLNCDSENWDELTVGCAGSVNLDFSKNLTRHEPTMKKAWRVDILGLKGGHSGERIGDGRGNAIRSLALLLLALREEGEVELAHFSGGTARNAIPEAAHAVFVSDLAQDRIEHVIREQKERFGKLYQNAEGKERFELKAQEMPKSVLVDMEALNLLQLLTFLHTGVFAMSQTNPQLVETSANIGIVTMTEDVVTVCYFPRSAIDAKNEEFAMTAAFYADILGFDLMVGAQSPGWAENKESRLAKIVADTFAEQNGKPMKIGAIHAGLECGWHFKKNPALDMVSIGVTTLDIHTPKERLVLATVAPQVKLILGTIEKIAKMKK